MKANNKYNNFCMNVLFACKALKILRLWLKNSMALVCERVILAF
jgi:hypothetical protein